MENKEKNTQQVEKNDNEILGKILSYVEVLGKRMDELEKEKNTENIKEDIVSFDNNVYVDDDDYVDIKDEKKINLFLNSIAASTTLITSSGKKLVMKNIGERRTITYKDFLDFYADNGNLFEKGMVYIDDKDVVDSVGLTGFYNKLQHPKLMKKIIENSTLDEFKEFYSKLIPSQKTDIKVWINTKTSQDEAFSRDKIRAITDIDNEEYKDEYNFQDMVDSHDRYRKK